VEFFIRPGKSMRLAMKIFLPGVLTIAGLWMAAPVSLSAQTSTAAGSAEAASMPATPRLPDGKPDLNGVWTNRGDNTDADVFVTNGLVSTAVCCNHSRLGGLFSAEQDGHVMRKGNRNKPMYKPEYWEKVRYKELHSQEEDPDFTGLCSSQGVPRMGQPQQIVQRGDLYVFLYAGGPIESTTNTFRVIPMNRPHDPKRVDQQTYKGDSVGHWDGDTLVVDTVGFNDESWLSPRLGYIHSTALHVVERLTRHGNEIKYEVTVEDPEALLQPWVLTPTTMKLNPDPNAMLPEDSPCSERDEVHTPIR
jgi:hypothetical protein